MDRRRRTAALAVAGSVLAATALVGATTAASDDERGYRFTIVNLAPGQPITPPVVVIHDKTTSIVLAGAPAGVGISQLAENGNAQPLLDALAGDAGVHATGMAEAPVVAGGVPGAAELPSVASVEVSA